MAEISRLPGPVADLWDWQLDGSCRRENPDVFFHPEGERGPARRNRDSAGQGGLPLVPGAAAVPRARPAGARAVRRLGRHDGGRARSVLRRGQLRSSLPAPPGTTAPPAPSRRTAESRARQGRGSRRYERQAPWRRRTAPPGCLAPPAADHRTGAGPVRGASGARRRTPRCLDGRMSQTLEIPITHRDHPARTAAQARRGGRRRRPGTGADRERRGQCRRRGGPAPRAAGAPRQRRPARRHRGAGRRLLTQPLGTPGHGRKAAPPEGTRPSPCGAPAVSGRGRGRGRHRRCRLLVVLLLHDQGLGGQHHRGDRRGVVQRRAGDLDRVDDAGLDQVAVLAGRGVEAVADLELARPWRPRRSPRGRRSRRSSAAARPRPCARCATPVASSPSRLEARRARGRRGRARSRHRRRCPPRSRRGSPRWRPRCGASSP